jgi:NAD-dependent dihydropyrimidine dehydrogenase PreA subunit
MAVQINWKICDNDKACGGIEVCPTGALFWNEAEATIGINNYFCISCRKCVADGCPVGAIFVTDSDEEYEQAKQDIIKDPHDEQQLFVDRFGAAPISDDVLIKKDALSKKTFSGITFVEYFKDSSIQCLIHSIKVDDVRYKTGILFEYYKCEITEDHETKEYPVLEIYVDGIIKGSIEGYFSEEQFDVFVNKINEILS